MRDDGTQGGGARDADGLDSDEALFQVGATRIIGALFVLLKVALVHQMENKAVEPAVLRFLMSVGEFQSKVAPDAALQFVGDAVYVNRRLVRTDLVTWEKAVYLKDFFARMRIAEIAFTGDVPQDSVRAFIQHARDVVRDAARAEEALGSRSYPGIAVRDLDAAAAAQSDEVLLVPDPVRVIRAYGVIVVNMRELLGRLERGQPVSLISVRRAFQEFARLPSHTRGLQLGVLSLEQYRGEWAGRLANTGVLVVMMGQRLGLSVGDLRDLGVAAATSGVGRALRDDLSFATPEECAAAGAYLEGARKLAASSGQGRAAALRLIAATEQSSAEGRRAGHPLSRLIAAAEAYDALTQRAPRGEGLSPDAALTRLLGSESIDRASARLLLCTMGLFPVGSTVKLTTGETAVVVDVPSNAQRLAEPRVLVVADAAGNPVQGRTVDLAGSRVTIAGMVEAAQLDLNVGCFLFA